MSNPAYLLLAAPIGYFFGAIPFGYLFVKATKKIDLRHVGSGRTGGTNSFRAAGLLVGVLTSISDVLKGAGAIWIARALFGGVLNESWLPWAEIVTGVAAVIGHNWSIFLAWGGGAGTGPNVGWSSAVWLPVLPAAVVVLLVVLLGVGMASVASLAVAVTVIVTFAVRFFTEADPTAAYFVGSILTGLVVAWALRPNIKRILNGTERLVGPAARRRQARSGA